MEISTAISALTTSATTEATSAEPVISSDFETFLQMLTAQARYQDPLEPIDSSEYAAQLAQFSMVEQQVLSNDLLTALAEQLSAGNISQMANWVGMDARTFAPVPFDGDPITVYPNPAARSDQVFLNVWNSSDELVQSLEMPVSAEPIQWAGVTDGGAPFPEGLYSFEVESRLDGEVILLEAAESYARIVEARQLDGETVLVLEGGSSILADSIAGLREPDAV